jgi:hypothetical protein
MSARASVCFIALAGLLALCDVAQAASYCFNNRSNSISYFSVRKPDGNYNFTLQPGQQHRFSLADLSGVTICYSKGPMTSDCPQVITAAQLKEREC